MEHDLVDVVLVKKYLRRDGTSFIHESHYQLPDVSQLEWLSFSFEPLSCSSDFFGCDLSLNIRLVPKEV